MGGHRGAFGVRDVGRIADEPLDGGKTGPGVGVEKVEVVEGDGGVMGVGVAAGDVQGTGADVAGMDGEGGEFAGEGYGDAAAAGADVEERAGGGRGGSRRGAGGGWDGAWGWEDRMGARDGAWGWEDRMGAWDWGWEDRMGAWEGGADRFDDPLDELFRLGPGDEDIFIDIKPHAGEPTFAEDILNGAVGQQFAAIYIVFPEEMVGKGLHRFGQAVDLLMSGQVFDDPIGDQCCFAATIEGSQVGGQLSLCLPEIHPVKINQFM